MTEDQRRAIQAFVQSAIVPLIEDVIVKKLGQAAIVLRDELAAPAQPPSNEVWPPDGAVWLAPVATDAPANPKLMQYAWGRSSLSSGQMAEAYQCIVSAAQECGQVYRLPLATPAQPKASEDAMCDRCRDWTVTMGVGDGSGSLFVHGTYDAIKACQRQLLHPKASEGKAGGEDAKCDGALHPALWPHSKEWYRLCERRFHADRISISGQLAEAIVEAIACGCCKPTATLTAPGADDER